MTGELTPVQADYFRTLERMNISDKFRRQIETVKAELRAENAASTTEFWTAAMRNSGAYPELFPAEPQP